MVFCYCSEYPTNSGAVLQQGCEINNDLMTLGRVVRQDQFATMESKTCALTHMFADTLSGHGYASLIVCCNPTRDAAMCSQTKHAMGYVIRFGFRIFPYLNVSVYSSSF
jgi:hypothetical protein